MQDEALADRDGVRQADVARAGTDQQLVATGVHAPALRLGVVVRERARAQLDRHRLRLARRERQLGEALQLLVRAARPSAAAAARRPAPSRRPRARRCC